MGVLKMDDKQFDQRMALLKKSYERMEAKLDPDTVFKQIEEEDISKELSFEIINKVHQRPSRWQKSVVWFVSIASVLLVGLLGTSYMIRQPETYNNSDKQISQENDDKTIGTYEKWVERITKKYKRVKEDISRELKVSVEELNTFSYIQNADSMLAFYTSYERPIEEDWELQIMEKEILDGLMTPRRALETIKGYGPLSFNESYGIFSLYKQSLNDIEMYFNSLLEPYEQFFKKKIDRSQYPSDLKAIIETASKQYMELHLDTDGSYYFKANPIDGEFAFEPIKYMHPDIFGYFEFLQKGFLVGEEGLRYTREETAESLKIMERSLLFDINTANVTYKELKAVFENTWLALMKGSTNYQVYAEKGIVNKEYLNFLQKVANGKYGEVMTKNAATILNELHQYNNSETLVGLSIQDISAAILQVRKDTAVEEFNIVDIDDAEIAQIKRIYDQYLKSDPEPFINQLSPLNMVSLYLYAISIGDESLQEKVILSNVEIEFDFLNKVKGLSIISQISQYNGIYPMVAVRLDEEHQKEYGKQILFRLSQNEDGFYRIIGIMD